MLSKKTPRRSADLAFLIGQSQIPGDNALSSASSIYLGAQPHCNIFRKPLDDASSTNNGIWQNYQYGLNQNWVTAAMTSCGPEISLGAKYYDLTGRDLWIVKYGYNGSGLVDTGTPYVNGLWQWNANPANVNGLPHYTNAVNNFLIPAILKAKANGVDLNFKSTIFDQGYTEAFGGTGYLTWDPVCIAMLDQILIDVAPYVTISPTYKPIIGRSHNNSTPGTRPFINEIRTAQANVAAHYSCPLINTDSLPLAVDLVHFTKPAMETYGIAIATELAAF